MSPLPKSYYKWFNKAEGENELRERGNQIILALYNRISCLEDCVKAGVEEIRKLRKEKKDEKEKMAR